MLGLNSEGNRHSEHNQLYLRDDEKSDDGSARPGADGEEHI